MVKYVFVSCGSFRIVNGISFINLSEAYTSSMH
jgi:hypothetical protein